MSLPEITDEDVAIGAEAMRLAWPGGGGSPKHSPAVIAAALARTGWKPVDPDLILAREVLAERWRTGGFDIPAAAVLAGDMDADASVTLALAAIKAVRREGERKG